MQKVCNLFVMKQRNRRNLLFMRILRAEICSSPATSSIKRVEKTLINSMFSLFFCAVEFVCTCMYDTEYVKIVPRS